MKNESHLIEEFLDHYLSMGVDRIFLIDNGSTDDTILKVLPRQKDGRVELVRLTEQHQQERHYWSAFQHFRIAERCEWLTVVDIDEFLFCKSGEGLGDYLDRQKGVDAIYVNWTLFGSSGFEAQPRSVRQSLLACDPKLARETKCIFRTSLPLRPGDIEMHNIRNAMPRRVKVGNRDLQLNHYTAQSREYWFNIKLKRGDAFFATPDMGERTSRFDRINDSCTASCTRLRDLVNLDSWHH